VFPEEVVPELDEGRLRRVLATVPVGRLRELGVLDALVRLAAAEPEAEVAAPDDDLIDELDVNDLVLRALSTAQAGGGEAGGQAITS
jgi:hypothetical protein